MVAGRRRSALVSEPMGSGHRRRNADGDLVERIGRAATLWSGRGRVLVGRDTRGSGPGARGRPHPRHRRRRGNRSARRRAPDAGRRPALAGPWRSSSPRPTTRPNTTASRSSIGRGTSSRTPTSSRSRRSSTRADRAEAAIEDAQDAVESYVDHILEHFGSDLAGSASRSTAPTAPTRRSPLACSSGSAPTSPPLAAAPDGTNINVGLRRNRSPDAPGGRPVGRLRPRGRVRRRRRPDARGRRGRRDGRRRPDHRHLRARAGRRPRRGDRHDKPRLPPADGRPRNPRRDDRRRRPATFSRRFGASAACSAESSRGT